MLKNGTGCCCVLFRRRCFWGRRQGMTLVEIMIVIVIIGVLMSVAVPAISKVRELSRIKQAEGELELIAAAIMQLAWDTGRWPTQQLRNNTGGYEVWNIKDAAAGLTASDGSYPNWNGPYIREVKDDPWGNPYFFDEDYHLPGKTIFVVGSFGPNGRGRNVYDADNILIECAGR